MTDGLWKGIVALIQERIDDGSFAFAYPLKCRNDGIFTTNRDSFAGATAVDNLPWPDRGMPTLEDAMDLIEFSHAKVAKAIEGDRYCYEGHQHLTFDIEQGQAGFREATNRMFSRHEMAFELLESGEVVRIPYPILREEITLAHFNTGDKDLDGLLEAARSKFLDPNAAERPAALEKLWDAWERLKSLEEGEKKASVKILLGKASKEEHFRNLLDSDAQELTKIGNAFQVRHFEKGKIPITENIHRDFLFHRLFSMIALFLRASKRM